ncbi:MAG: tyrosine-type recombinase/integrase [Rhodoferax sp.]|nr:tyrosine-type recombinase/integrase [Rhodoferax sp.]
MLTVTAIQKAKPTEKQYRLTDERGLTLLVRTNGSKLWQLRYRHEGKEKTASLGQFPDVSLADARAKRDDLRKVVAAGSDPVAVKREERLVRLAQAENTFEIVARQWYEHWKGPKNARHAGYVLSRLEADVFPAIGSRPIAEILAPELVAMVKTIEKRGALDIAKRCLQMTGQVFRYAIAHGVGGATRNPATDIKPTDVLTPRTKENYARIDARELPELLRKIEAYQGTPITRLAIKLMALTFVRTGELIGARWAEFNLDAARWDIPASRMKMKTPHVVPLCSQAIEVLRVLHTATGGRELLFPGERDHAKPMSNNTILGALDRMGYKGKMTGHGFRGVASTILHEHGFDHMHIELQLAHIERNAVSAAYNHALYLDQRAKMMAWWGNYLDSLTRSNVLPLRSLAA